MAASETATSPNAIDATVMGGGIHWTELTADEREQLERPLERRHRGSITVRQTSTSYVIDVGVDSQLPFEAALTAFAAAALRFDQAATFARLLSAMTPPRTAGRGITVQAQRNAAERAALEDEFGLLTSAEVAKAAGARAKNTSSLPSRWRKEGRIFAVPGSDGAHLYPAFQFDSSGQPLPAIAAVIAPLIPVMDGWSLALWFIGSNGWLGGERPVDVLGDEQVINAAQQLAAEIS